MSRNKEYIFRSGEYEVEFRSEGRIGSIDNLKDLNAAGKNKYGPGFPSYSYEQYKSNVRSQIERKRSDK